MSAAARPQCEDQGEFPAPVQRVSLHGRKRPCYLIRWDRHCDACEVRTWRVAGRRGSWTSYEGAISELYPKSW